MERLLPYLDELPRVALPRRRLRARRAWTAASTSCRRRSTRWRRRTWRSRTRTPCSCASSSGSTPTRPLICQVSRFDPWKDPLGVIDAYRLVKARAARRAARARRLDGQRRSRGLGLLQLDARARRRRPGHPHPQQLQQRRRDRGQRVPVARRRRDPEVDARGLRPDGERGAVEGAAVHRRRRRRHPAAGRRTASRATSSPPSRSAPRARSASSTTRRSGTALGRHGKEHVRANFLTPRYLRDYLRIFHEVL